MALIIHAQKITGGAMTDKSISLKFAGTCGNVALAGDCIKAICLNADLAWEDCSHLVQDIVEILNNVIRNIYREYIIGEILLTAAITSGSLIIEIKYPGISPNHIINISTDEDSESARLTSTGGNGLSPGGRSFDHKAHELINGYVVLTLTRYLAKDSLTPAGQ